MTRCKRCSEITVGGVQPCVSCRAAGAGRVRLIHWTKEYQRFLDFMVSHGVALLFVLPQGLSKEEMESAMFGEWVQMRRGNKRCMICNKMSRGAHFPSKFHRGDRSGHMEVDDGV